MKLPTINYGFLKEKKFWVIMSVLIAIFIVLILIGICTDWFIASIIGCIILVIYLLILGATLLGLN